MNTTIATGTPPSDGFLAWRAYCKAHPDLQIGKLMQRGTAHLSDAEIAAYDAPYPDARYKAGVRAFPEIVMTGPGMPGVSESVSAEKYWSTRWNGQTFMAIGATDPVLGLEVMEALRTKIRGCPPPLIVRNAGHFVQEWGENVASAALASFAQDAARVSSIT